ncbi:MAG: MFS transporter [Gracilibacteraceae bacterium]|jgi:putative MFS transporter|nr:MFS transporter [Gracilibacteraceae bacterium]
MSTERQSFESIAARLDRIPISRWHNKLLVLLGLGILADGIDNYFSSSVLAAVLDSGFSTTTLNAYFISFTMLGWLIGAYLIGIIGDRFGRKSAMKYNLIFFGCASIAASFAPNMIVLIVCRSVLGMGMGAQYAATYGSFGEYLPPKNRGQYSGLVSTIANFGPPIATFMAMMIIPVFTWRPLWFIVGVFGLIVCVLQHFYLEESPRWLAQKGRIEEADAIVTRVEKNLEAKGVELAAVNYDALTQEITQDLPYSALFKGTLAKRTITFVVGMCGMNIATYTMVNWIPTILKMNGMSLEVSLRLTTVMLIAAPIGCIICAGVANHVPRKTALIVCLLGMCVTSIVYSLQKEAIMIMAIGFILMLFLYFYITLICSVYATEIFPVAAKLRGVGLGNSASRIAAIVTPPGVAWLLNNFGSVSVFVAVSICLFIVAIVVAIFGVETRHKTLEEINEKVLFKNG